MKHYVIIALSLSLTGIVALLSSNIKQNTIQKFSLQEILSDRYVANIIESATGEFEEDQSTYVFNNKSYPLPQEQLRDLAYKPERVTSVLGATTDNKKIIVDLSKQRVYAYEGDQLALNFLISSGKYGATPTGKYKIWYKVRSQTMKGGSKELGTYYYLPNVQFIQYFNQGIGFHSTYWHNNFGTPMSHGCINMTTTDAETLYYWANPVMPSGVKIFRSSNENPGTEVEVVDSWKM